jgi:hypothetical protein
MTIIQIGNVNTWTEPTTIAAGDTLRFRPDFNTILNISYNLIIEGTLEMKPEAGKTHTLNFTDIDETTFGDGGGLVVVDSDVGLWVMEDGKLDIVGAEKTGWLRTTEGLSAGATSLTLESTPTGWAVGDEIVIVPTSAWPSASLSGSVGAKAAALNGFEVVTITEIDEATISWSGGLSSAHPAIPSPVSLTPEVANLTRTVNINGTDATHRSHVFVHTHTEAHTIKWATFRYMGPQKNGKVITGRWPIHFHHAGNSTIGSEVTGCVVRNAGSHAYVPHLSHGITFTDCVAYDVRSSPYWWDVIDPTNTATWDHCLAARVQTGLDELHSTAGYYLGKGSGNICTDSVAVGVGSGKSGGGFLWNSNANGTASHWTADDLVSHDNSSAGTRVWQNSTPTKHTTNRFVAYHNAGEGIQHGAYVNRFQFFDSVCYNNNEGAQKLFANSQNATDLILHDGATYEGGKYSVVVTEHNLHPIIPLRFYDCDFNNATVVPIEWDDFVDPDSPRRTLVDFVNCRVNGEELEPEHFRFTSFIPDNLVRVQRSDDTAYQFTSVAGVVTLAEIDQFYDVDPVPLAMDGGLSTPILGGAYSETLTASGGTAPYVWSIAAGQLPPGLTLSSGGVVSGTPTTLGGWSVTIRVTDAAATIVSQEFALTVVEPVFITISPTLPRGFVDIPYAQTLYAAGGVKPYVWSTISGSETEQGALPDGLELELDDPGDGTGILSGTPTTEGTYTFTLGVQDSVGASDELECSLLISPFYQASKRRQRSRESELYLGLVLR